MKLSELSTEKATDVLCEITPYVCNIVSDEELLSELRNAIKTEKALTTAEMIVLGVDKVTKLVPIVLGKRKSDLFGIIGALNGKTADEIAAQNFIVTGKQLKDIIKDRDLLDFFKSCVSTEGDE